jgi:amidohydrolase
MLDRALLCLRDDSEWLYDLAERLWNSPELGFFEFKTAEIIGSELKALGFSPLTGIARTGVWADLGNKNDPAVMLLADMDALPSQTVPGGNLHSCGHHAQMAVMLGVFRVLAKTGAAEKLGLRIVFAGSPAEEYVDLGRRLELRRNKEIVYLSGKQEMIRLGFFDAPLLVLKYHSMGDSPERIATVNGSMNGFLAKRAEFIGRAAHAGAQPEKGVNALSAASLALQAIHAQRESFMEDDHIRVHPILTQGGTVVNSVPDRAVLETYIRGASHEAVLAAAVKVDRSLRAGALALGAGLRIATTPGYQAFNPDPALGDILGGAAASALDKNSIDFDSRSYASDDIGDVACIQPTCQLRFSGFSGDIHSADFTAKEPERAYRAPAEILLRTLAALGADNAAAARRILKGFTPRFSVSGYLASLDQLFSYLEYPGEALEPGEKA